MATSNWSTIFSWPTMTEPISFRMARMFSCRPERSMRDVKLMLSFSGVTGLFSFSILAENFLCGFVECDEVFLGQAETVAPEVFDERHDAPDVVLRFSRFQVQALDECLVQGSGFDHILLPHALEEIDDLLFHQHAVLAFLHIEVADGLYEFDGG